MTISEQFYETHPSIEVIQPKLHPDQLNRLLFMWKNFWWLRRLLKTIQSDVYLSFGGKYNAFVLLSNSFLQNKIFISDRSKPSISYGLFLDFLNPIVYRMAYGIVAQTERAKESIFNKTNHRNIRVIGNPIPQFEQRSTKKKNRILNVGRFISTKHQNWLVNYFKSICPVNWELHFYGNGPLEEQVKKQAEDQANIYFHGNKKDLNSVYAESAVFAFTSTSEGFPNALAEAMSAGCACISFDCEAGPSDLIENEVNGFLIPEGDHELYQKKLFLLIHNEELRTRLGTAAIEKMKQYNSENITRRYIDFMLE